MSPGRRFPEGFVWGAATAAYQIEGAVAEDGRGESIWDRFSHTPGRVAGGDTGDVACDHYHRWRDDVALMAELGLDAYRFSVAWPRIVPEGRGRVNPAGLGFYDRLVDELLEAGIEPWVTLYHWDLPLPLEDSGGWPTRPTAEAFAEYAGVVAERLGDRVTRFATLNEPWVVATLGYGEGVHAPGRRSTDDAMAAAHHLLVAHGLGCQAVRAAASDAKVGIVLDFEPKHPATDHPDDVAAAGIADDLMNRWYLDPIAGRGYPRDGAAAVGWRSEQVLPGDLDLIAGPIDFLGVNYYTRQVVHADTEQAPPTPPGPVTDMGWEIHPDGLGEVLDRIREDYGIGPLYITENGAAFDDTGTIAPFDDRRRVAFLAGHLEAVLDSIAKGAPVAGYFVWSLLDNFEWAWGYGPRFGIVRVDYTTQERTVRRSGRWYAGVAGANALPAGDGP